MDLQDIRETVISEYRRFDITDEHEETMLILRDLIDIIIEMQNQVCRKSMSCSCK